MIARAFRAVATLPPLAILGLGWLLFVAYAYPGLMTKDSFDHLAQARSGFYLDDHPPAMAAIWAITDWFVVGPFGMLIVQSTVFLVALQRVLRRAMQPRPAALAACLILLFPPVLAPMTVIWKDSLMASFLMLGISALLDERRGVQVAGLVALVLATALRYNAPAATLPLVVVLFVWLRPAAADRPWRQRIQRYGLAVAAWAGITVVAFGANAALADRKMHLWHSSLAIGDIVGTLHFTPSTSTDTSMRRALAGTHLVIDQDIHAYARANYVPGDFLQLVYGDKRMFELPLVNATQPAPPETRDAIWRAWRTIVGGHWIAYLRYRLDTFRVVLGFDHATWDRTIVVTHPYQDVKALEAAGIPAGYSWFQARTGELIDALSQTPLFRPFVFLFIALALLAFARPERDVAAILLSGLGLEASLFLLAGSADYRYSHWLVCATIAAATMLVARRYRRDRTPA